ncbi:hypothetical protein HDF18_13525 [Mucilaginibacter sp. X5P1]|uniref:hypothetical protein n=1 Tax=Mucilaginibacter sp. X5P1 TaxID=2723088 RepID=UPI0017EF2A44|nr:hypothetical protein [Mucilaginibacter sp. X5P1]
MTNNIFPSRQQKSFGRNLAKQWWPCAWQGIADFCSALATAAIRPQKYSSLGFA